MAGAVVLLLNGRVEKDEEGGYVFSFPEDIAIDLKSVHIVVVQPGQVRGNHVHPNRIEYLFFFGGQGTIFWETQGHVRQLDVGEDGHLLRVAAGVKHAYKNTGDTPAYILACKGPSGVKGPDTVEVEILAQADDPPAAPAHA